MENLVTPISQVLGIAIVHSLWQGLLVCVLFKAITACMPGMSSIIKYRVAYSALLITTAWFAYTLYSEVSTYNWYEQADVNFKAMLPFTKLHVLQQAQHLSDRYFFSIKPFLPYVSLIYAAGLFYNVFRLLWAWRNIYQAKQNLLPADDLEIIGNRLAVQLNISRYVTVAYSKYVNVPCIIGFFKPLILLPLALPVHLSAQEIRSVILHELAHVRRNDYVMNIAQQLMSVMLFFNPFAQLLNRIINNERENCCDDVVVTKTGQPLVYAQALLKLEENRQHKWQLALAATGNKYYLLNRIQRIMKTNKPISNTRHLFILMLVLAGSISSIAWLNPKLKNGELSVKSIPLPKFTDDSATFLSMLEADSDTIKKKPAAKKTRPVKTAKKTIKTSINNFDVYYSDTSFHDAELERLAKEVEKHGNRIGELYNSPAFKKYAEQMEAKGKEMEAYYNRPEFKNLIAEQEKQAKEMEIKWHNSPEMKKLTAEMESLGKQMEAHYNSPEYKKLQKQLEVQSELLNSYNYDSPEYKKQLAALRKVSQEFRNKTNSPLIKQQRERMQELSKQLSSRFNSQEYLQQRERLTALGDSLRKVYGADAMRAQQDEMRKLGDAMRNFQNSDEVTTEQKQLREASEKLRRYQQTPEFKQKVKEYKKTHPNSNININN